MDGNQARKLIIEKLEPLTKDSGWKLIFVQVGKKFIHVGIATGKAVIVVRLEVNRLIIESTGIGDVFSFEAELCEPDKEPYIFDLLKKLRAACLTKAAEFPLF